MGLATISGPINSKELLNPRYEVISIYPNSKLIIGEIISAINHKAIRFECIENDLADLISYPENYPHIFKKLNWWEKRKVEDMPKKVKCMAISSGTTVIEIEEWDMNLLVGWTNKEKRECCDLIFFESEYGYFPID